MCLLLDSSSNQRVRQNYRSMLVIPPKKIFYAGILAFIATVLFSSGSYLISITFTAEAKFTQELQDVTVQEGGNAKFFIEVNSLTADVMWMKDGKVLQQTERFIMRKNGLKHRLIILNSTVEDKGLYSCILKKSSCSATLTVEESSKPFVKTSTLILGAKVVAGAAAAVGVAAAALPLAGFTATGVAASSMAAAAQSYVGCVGAGSAFAALQSAGAAGMALTTKAVIAAGGAAIAALTNIGTNSTES